VNEAKGLTENVSFGLKNFDKVCFVVSHEIPNSIAEEPQSDLEFRTFGGSLFDSQNIALKHDRGDSVRINLCKGLDQSIRQMQQRIDRPAFALDEVARESTIHGDLFIDVKQQVDPGLKSVVVFTESEDQAKH
jgi:hypothetical protein